jgi:hypothetical protein
MTQPPDIVSDIMSRLPAGSRISLVDVCVAVDKHRDVVEGWIYSGEVEAIDLGGGRLHCWEIYRASLEAFLRRRKDGVRKRHDDPNQLDLFSLSKP